MKWIKILLISSSLIMLLLASAAGGLYYLLTRSPKLPPNLTPPPISSEATIRLENKLTQFFQEIEKAAQAEESRPVSLEITEEEINSLIDKELPTLQQELPFEIKSVQVYFREGEIKAITKLDLPGISPVISAGFNPEALKLISEGKVQEALNQVNLNLGKLPLPGGIEEQIKSGLASGLSELKLPLKLTEVTAEEGKLIIKGVTQETPP